MHREECRVTEQQNAYLLWMLLTLEAASVPPGGLKLSRAAHGPAQISQFNHVKPNI